MRTEKLANHLRISQYDAFQLTDAIRPGLNVPVVPKEGFRLDTYSDAPKGVEVPVLASAVSKEKLFDLFLALLEPLGSTVDLVLETSHHSEGASHRDLFREQIEQMVLQSYLCEFEDLLLNDGCTGVAVISNKKAMEVQFDEHKLLIVYAHDLEPFERTFFQHDVLRYDKMRLITEGEHYHSTENRHLDAFEQLCTRVGVDEPAESYF